MCDPAAVRIFPPVTLASILACSSEVVLCKIQPASYLTFYTILLDLDNCSWFLKLTNFFFDLVATEQLEPSG